MHVNVKISIAPLENQNDFYLQWDYIFWWQMRFNFRVCADMVHEKIKEDMVR